MAEHEAQALGHRHVGTEHLLLGILAAASSPAARALVASGATHDGCRHKITEAVPVEEGAPGAGDPQFTDRAKRALERASRLSLRQHDEQVEIEHVLVSLLDVEGTAGQVLRGLGVDIPALRTAVDSTIEEGRSRRDAADGPATRRSSPRCAACGSALDSALAHRVVTSRGDAGPPMKFVVAYCASCGSVVGATVA